MVLDCDGLAIGRLRDHAWEASDNELVEQVMEPGPGTVRPHSLLQPLVDRMAKRNVKLVLVTTPEGRLVGAMVREEAERFLAGEAPEEIWEYCEGCPSRWAVREMSYKHEVG